MKFKILALVLLLAASCSPKQSKEKEIVSQMTLEEKAAVVVGHLGAMNTGSFGADALNKIDFDYPGLGMPIGGVPRLGIPVTICSDGSYGLKRYMPRPDGKWGITAFPVPALLASTWDTELEEDVAGSYGSEGKEYGVDVLLGPAMNIMRDPLCGRNFEYYSEDPLLSGKMGAAAVRGIQSNGIGTTIKHFVANNQETDRVVNDARVSKRALREIYLRGFEMAAKEADPWFFMVSYNKLNGPLTTENRDLLQTIVRGDWGYGGTFMSDFGGNCWTPVAIAAGMDLVMPGSTAHEANIVNAVNSGELSEEDLDYCVENVLRYAMKTPRYKGCKYEGNPDLEAHAALARKAAAQGMVLLENDGTLPCNPVKPAFFGVSSYRTWTSGIGSGKVVSDYTVNLADGFPVRDEASGAFYAKLLADADAAKPKLEGFAALMALSADATVIPESVIPAGILEKSASEADVAFFTIGRNAGEGEDRRPVPGDWSLNEVEYSNLKAVSEAFHAKGKKLIVVLNVNGAVETASWKDLADAVLLVWLPGQEGGNAFADVVTGRVNPSGHLPVTFPVRYEDCPSYGNFPTGDEKKDIATADNGFQVEYAAEMNIFQNGAVRYQPKPREQWIRNVDYTVYEEDVYVGYRYYGTFGKAVSYPFGYGLSYTDFSRSAPAIQAVKDGWEAEVTVTNTGNVAGRDVVQLYAEAPEGDRPVRELVAFGKTGTLAPGESQTVTLHFGKRELSRYDEPSHSFVLDKGEWRIVAAEDAASNGPAASLTIKKSRVVEVTSDVCGPVEPIHVLKRK